MATHDPWALVERPKPKTVTSSEIETVTTFEIRRLQGLDYNLLQEGDEMVFFGQDLKSGRPPRPIAGYHCQFLDFKKEDDSISARVKFLREIPEGVRPESLGPEALEKIRKKPRMGYISRLHSDWFTLETYRIKSENP